MDDFRIVGVYFERTNRFTLGPILDFWKSIAFPFPMIFGILPFIDASIRSKVDNAGALGFTTISVMA
jgi:hypothetical protein